VTKTGVLEYLNPDGSIRREYRPPDEVFHADSLASLQDAPVTNLHQGMIDSKNWRKVAVGSLSGAARQDGDHVLADLAVQDSYTIELIESGDRREVSTGYHCRLDRTPGTAPDGTRYDVIQRDIRYNHVALVPRGRGGRDVALRLDSADHQISPEGPESTTMKIEIIGGVEYEVGTAPHVKAARDRDAAEALRLDAASKAETALAVLTAENKDLRARLDAAPAAIAAGIKARADLEAGAARFKIEVRADMSDEDVRRAVIAKAFPEMDLTDRDEAFTAGVFEAALRASVSGSNAAKVREDAAAAKRGESRTDAGPAVAPDVLARQKMIERASARPSTAKTTLDKS